MGLKDAVTKFRQQEADARKAKAKTEPEPVDDDAPATVREAISQGVDPGDAEAAVAQAAEETTEAPEGATSSVPEGVTVVDEPDPEPDPGTVAAPEGVTIVAEREDRPSQGGRIKFVGHESGATVLVYLPTDQPVGASVTVHVTDE